MELIVERISQGIVILEQEDLSHLHVPLNTFDFPVKEGDVLSFDGERYCYEEKKTMDLRKEVQKLNRDLFKK